MSFFPVNCGLSVLENIIDVEGVSVPVSCVYTDLWDMYTQTWRVQNKKENVQIWCWKLHLRHTASFAICLNCCTDPFTVPAFQ